jgi:hypothetical protein
METIYTILQNFQLDLFQVFICGLVVATIAFWAGRAKSKKLERKMAKMEKEILDLNAELLGTERPAGVLKKMNRQTGTGH